MPRLPAQSSQLIVTSTIVAIAATLALSGCAGITTVGATHSSPPTPVATQRLVEKFDTSVFNMPLGSSAEQLAGTLVQLYTARWGGKSAYTLAQAKAYEDPQYLNTSQEAYSADEAKREVTALYDAQAAPESTFSAQIGTDELQFSKRFFDLITTSQNPPDLILDDHFSLDNDPSRPILAPTILSGDPNSPTDQIVIRYYMVENNNAKDNSIATLNPTLLALNGAVTQVVTTLVPSASENRYRIANEQVLMVDP